MTRREPVRRVTVDAGVPAMLGHGVAISWELFPEYATRDLRFTVCFGRYPNDSFVVVGSTDNQTYYEDPVDRRLNADVLTRWYALKTQDLESNEVWYSAPVHAGAAWRKREWLVAREITRQEYARLIKRRAGTRGWLLRRRFSGTRCTACVEPETGRVTDANCLTCYGTGFVDGYYPEMECWLDLNPPKLMRRLTPDQGIISGSVKTARTLAYPPANPNDVWVCAKTGVRYVIGEEVVRLAELENEPLIVQVDLQQQESNHVIYSVPVSAT